MVYRKILGVGWENDEFISEYANWDASLLSGIIHGLIKNSEEFSAVHGFRHY